MDYSLLMLCFVASSAATFIIIKVIKGHKARLEAIRFAELTASLSESKAQLQAMSLEKQRLISEAESIAAHVSELQTENKDLSSKLASAGTEISYLQKELGQGARKAKEQQDMLMLQFSNIAREILEGSAEKLMQSGRESIGNLVSPLNTQLSEFKSKLAEGNEKQLIQRQELITQIRSLTDINKRLGRDAEQLARALEGDYKKQGNWGELILQRLLEYSGLSEGREFFTQVSHKTKDGHRLQPDVVLQMPGERYIVIDSKLSLNSYKRHCDAPDSPEHLKDLLSAIRKHINSLGSKNYHELYGPDSPDFVVMFIPIEPAFMLAISSDEQLYSYAWEKSVVLCSPTTLLPILRTVVNLWQTDRQNSNAKQIADMGAKLYDKFATFLTELEKIGARLDSARSAYDDALKKLSSGKGNLIDKARQMKELGLPTKRQISDK